MCTELPLSTKFRHTLIWLKLDIKQVSYFFFQILYMHMNAISMSFNEHDYFGKITEIVHFPAPTVYMYLICPTSVFNADCWFFCCSGYFFLTIRKCSCKIKCLPIKFVEQLTCEYFSLNKITGKMAKSFGELLSTCNIQ